MATALGGEPIGVPIPPMLAAAGTQMINPLRKGSSSFKLMNKGATKVIIIAVVAVLLMNMEKPAVTNIMPSMTIDGRSPNIFRMVLAKALSTPSFTAAAARINPPKNKISTGSAKG